MHNKHIWTNIILPFILCKIMNVTEVYIFGSFVIIFLQQEGWACASVAAPSRPPSYTARNGSRYSVVNPTTFNPRKAEFELSQSSASSPLPVGCHRLQRTTVLSQHRPLQQSWLATRLGKLMKLNSCFNFKLNKGIGVHG